MNGYKDRYRTKLEIVWS